MIYTLCIFISTALGFNKLTFDLGFMQINGFEMSMLVIGVVMVLYTTLGGLWAVMVTDAMQFLIILLISLTLLPLAYAFLGDGSIVDGVTRLVREAPAGYFDIDIKERPPIFWLAYTSNIILGYNVNWHIAQRYYSVPDERDAKKMALWCAVLSIILPMTWISAGDDLGGFVPRFEQHVARADQTGGSVIRNTRARDFAARHARHYGRLDFGSHDELG